jgi:hypothetical protein
MSLVMDETLVPALGLSPPNRAFPAVTHSRASEPPGLRGGAALTAEAVYRLTRDPRPAHVNDTRP